MEDELMRLVDSMVALAILVMAVLALGGMFRAMSRTEEVAHGRALESIVSYAVGELDLAEGLR